MVTTTTNHLKLFFNKIIDGSTKIKKIQMKRFIFQYLHTFTIDGSSKIKLKKQIRIYFFFLFFLYWNAFLRANELENIINEYIIGEIIIIIMLVRFIGQIKSKKNVLYFSKHTGTPDIVYTPLVNSSNYAFYI